MSKLSPARLSLAERFDALETAMQLINADRELRKPTGDRTRAPEGFGGCWQATALNIATTNYGDLVRLLDAPTAAHVIGLIAGIRSRVLLDLMRRDEVQAEAAMALVSPERVWPARIAPHLLGEPSPVDLSDSILEIVVQALRVTTTRRQNSTSSIPSRVWPAALPGTRWGVVWDTHLFKQAPGTNRPAGPPDTTENHHVDG